MRFFTAFRLLLLGLWIGGQKHGGMTDARTLAFSALVLGNLGLIIANRAHASGLLRSFRTPNPAFWAVVTGTIGVLALVLVVPPVRGLFQFGPLHLDDLAISAGLTLVLVLALVMTGRLGRSSPARPLRSDRLAA